jgi:hypothetical protein
MTLHTDSHAWQWRITVGGKENIARQIQITADQISETVRNSSYKLFFLRITDTMTSQNTDLSSCDTLYNTLYMHIRILNILKI